MLEHTMSLALTAIAPSSTDPLLDALATATANQYSLRDKITANKKWLEFWLETTTPERWLKRIEAARNKEEELASLALHYDEDTLFLINYWLLVQQSGRAAINGFTNLRNLITQAIETAAKQHGGLRSLYKARIILADKACSIERDHFGFGAFDRIFACRQIQADVFKILRERLQNESSCGDNPEQTAFMLAKLPKRGLLSMVDLPEQSHSVCPAGAKLLSVIASGHEQMSHFDSARNELAKSQKGNNEQTYTSQMIHLLRSKDARHHFSHGDYSMNRLMEKQVLLRCEHELRRCALETARSDVVATISAVRDVLNKAVHEVEQKFPQLCSSGMGLSEDNFKFLTLVNNCLAADRFLGLWAEEVEYARSKYLAPGRENPSVNEIFEALKQNYK